MSSTFQPEVEHCLRTRTSGRNSVRHRASIPWHPTAGRFGYRGRLLDPRSSFSLVERAGLGRVVIREVAGAYVEVFGWLSAAEAYQSRIGGISSL